MRDVSFQLDIDSAAAVITDMARPVVEQSAKGIASRANTIAGSMSSEAPSFTATTKVGRIKKGQRAIGTISASVDNSRESYIAHSALSRAKDGGSIN